MIKTPEVHMINDKFYLPETRNAGDISFPHVTLWSAQSEKPSDFFEFNTTIYHRTHLADLSIHEGITGLQVPSSLKHIDDKLAEYFTFGYERLIRDSIVEWAVMRSFDGLSVKYETESFEFSKRKPIRYRIYVYLKSEHSTYITLQGARDLHLNF